MIPQRLKVNDHTKKTSKVIGEGVLLLIFIYTAISTLMTLIYDGVVLTGEVTGIYAPGYILGLVVVGSAILFSLMWLLLVITLYPLAFMGQVLVTQYEKITGKKVKDSLKKESSDERISLKYFEENHKFAYIGGQV